jgi:hypothetical protein
VRGGPRAVLGQGEPHRLAARGATPGTRRLGRVQRGFETPRRVALTHQDVSVDPAAAQCEHVRRDIERTMQGVEQMCAAAGARFEDFDLSARRSMVRLSGSAPAMIADLCTVLAQVRSASLPGGSAGPVADPSS